MNYMIDIETLSTRIDAAIIEIGVAAFTDEEVVKSHRWLIEPHGYIDPATVAWWFNLISTGTPNPLDPSLGIRVPLPEALKDLSSRMKEVETVWAHRSSFDFPIIGMAYSQSGIPRPWTNKEVRDTITLGKMYPEIPRIEADEKHNSEADAVAQAQWMVNVLKYHKG